MAAAQQDGGTDIAAFRVTDVGGEVTVRYELDAWNQDGPGSDSFTRTPMWQEELTLQARGYAYHPALLDWTLGGGPLLVQYAYDSNQGSSDGTETLFNLDIELNFLQRRGFPFTLYARRDHPEFYTGLSGRFLTESDEYGARGVLRPPLLPVFVFWDVAHWESQGAGFGTTVDEDVDRASLRTSTSYRKTDNIRLDLDWNRRNSSSGGPGLPIQESLITTYTAQLDGDNHFGSDVTVNQRLYWRSEDTQLDQLTEIDTLAYTATSRWQHSGQTRSFGNYRYSDTDRTDDWSRSHELQVGATHDMDTGLSLTGEGRYGRDDAPQFTREVLGARGLVRYSRPFGDGTLGLSAGVVLDRTDQQAGTDRVSVFDEQIVLAGIEPVPLARDFVVPETVVVTNVPKTQTFVADVDYRLVAVGSETTIERLITGSIEDGQTVLVSYEVLTGGTVEYDTLGAHLSASLGIHRYASLFLNVNDVRNDVLSGIATTPLNDMTRVEVGGRVDYPLVAGWTIGGEYRYTDQDEDISPYTRDSYHVYVQSARYWNSTLRIGIRRETVDNLRSPEDVDLWRYLATLSSRLRGGATLTYNADFSEDTGGSLPRKDLRHSLRLDWGYRLLRFTLRADYSDIRQGQNQRDNTRVVAEIRRVF